ncbi:MAG TPA: ATP-binding protein [Rubricoccaceae bacterium]|jgi:signal transduction histidine kinase
MRNDLSSRFTLRFRDASAEEAFLTGYDERSRPLVRAALALGLLQYAAFGWLDRWVAPLAFAEVRSVRIVVCLIVAAAIAMTYHARLRRLVQPEVVGALVGGLGVVAMEWAMFHATGVARTPIPSDELVIGDGYYYAGMMLILIYVHVLLRLRFVTATAIGAGLIGLYLAVAALHTPPIRLANAFQFLISTQASGMVASYALERYARSEFVNVRRQVASNEILTAALERLTSAQDRLVHAEKMASLGRVTAGVAHEIQNPLNFVTNFATMTVELAADLRALLADGLRTEAALAEAAETVGDIADNAARIEEHGARASAVVKGMLEHGGRARAGRRTADLNAVVAEHAALARRAAERTSGAETPAPDLDLDPAVGSVVVLPEDVGRVVQNVVGNAYQAVGSDGTVRVTTRRLGDAVEIVVADTGCGMPADVAARAFEPFFSTRPTGSGTGLGLSLAYDIVTDGHGGEIALESAEGEGTTVRISLPAVREAAPREAAPHATALRETPSRVRAQSPLVAEAVA